MRVTYRTARVFEAVAELPGASNRVVAEGSGIHDQGQVSRLLGRLEGLGLLANDAGAKGVTSTTFKQVPDEPVGSFTLTLPEGPYSALAANTNLCKITCTVVVRRRVTVKRKGRKRIVTRNVSEHVKGKSADADHLRRPERRQHPPRHPDRRHRLPRRQGQAHPAPWSRRPRAA